MKISSEYDKSTPRSSPTKQGGQPPPLVGCSSFPGSSWKWGAAASWAAKTASQSPSMNSLTEDDDKSSLFIYQTWIFCKKNGSKRSFLSEIGAQTFCYALYAVTTACCISWQISKLEIWRNTAGKSARVRCTWQQCAAVSSQVGDMRVWVWRWIWIGGYEGEGMKVWVIFTWQQCAAVSSQVGDMRVPEQTNCSRMATPYHPPDRWETKYIWEGVSYISTLP